MAATQDPQSIISSTEPQIKSLQDQISKFQASQDASPTASSSLTNPTFRDLSNETQQDALQTQMRALEKQNLTAAWYGADTGSASADQGGTPGIIGKALNTLQIPLQTVVKGVKTAIGDTTQVPGQDFTDLLAQHGVRGALGTALGFTADVALDPVNWLTMGTGALIPRVGVGLVKGAAEGGIEQGLRAGAAGLTSSLGQKAAFVASHTPFVGGADTSFAKLLSEKAAASYENYKNLANVHPENVFGQAGIGRGIPQLGGGLTLGDLTRGTLGHLPFGDDLYKSMYYNSRNWLDNAMAMDRANAAKAATSAESLAAGAPSAAAIAARESPTFEAGLAKPNPQILASFPAGQEKNAAIDALNKIAEEKAWMDANPGKVLSVTPEQNTDRLIQELAAADQLRVVLSPAVGEFGAAGGPTGIKWFDDLTKWGNGVKVKIGPKEYAPIKIFSDVYNSIIQGVFKPNHTVLSPSTWAMNVLSAPPMYMMMGGENVAGFVSDYMRFYKGLAGVDPRANVVDAFLGQATQTGKAWQRDVAANAARAKDVRGFIEQNPETFRGSYGVGPGYMFGHYDMGEAVRKLVNSGDYTEAQAASGEVEQAILAAQKEFQDALRTGNVTGEPTKTMGQKLTGLFGKLSKGPKAETPSMVSESLRKSVEESGVQGALRNRAQGLSNIDVAGQTIRDADVRPELLDKAEAFINAKVAEGSKPFKLYKSLMDNARAGYEHQDQAFRMAVANQLMNHGITENGLKVMTRFVNMRNPETQILSTYTLNGQKMYRLSMDYATEVAHEAAINYGAMPAVVKMLRSIPVVGAPFASFGYGMATKTMQTLAYNPSFYNKVSFGIQSASGGKTPLEKEALKSKYYGWYNDPSMLRVPDQMNFFSQYPLYMNLSNALPYYSLNIFQTSNRSYASVLPDTVVKTLDALPVLKDPVGQALFDNFLLPSIISSTERPLSSMGSPLYPINATNADKAFYAGRGLADSLFPAVAAPAGLVLPSSAAKYYPGYRTRQMAYGKDQRNQLGIPGSETSSSRFIRNILGYLGIPIQQADTTYAASQVKSGTAP